MAIPSPYFILFLLAAAWCSAGARYIAYNTSAGIVDGKLNVHLVAHSHDDVGWLKTIDQYYVGSKNSIQVSNSRIPPQYFEICILLVLVL